MTVICVSQDKLLIDDLVSLCRTAAPDTDVIGFTGAETPQEWLKERRTDLAMIDTDMPDRAGFLLAENIRNKNPETAVILLSSAPEDAVDAFALHVSGFLLKPADASGLAAEISRALSEKRPESPVFARTFGRFALFAGGMPVAFRQARCAELLAYLIDRQGGSVTRSEAFAILWEDRMYNRSMQKQLDVIVRSLRHTLEENGIGGIFENRRGSLRIRPEKITCDAWRFFNGDPEALSTCRGEYMSGYSWAAETRRYIRLKYKNAVRQTSV